MAFPITTILMTHISTFHSSQMIWRFSDGISA